MSKRAVPSVSVIMPVYNGEKYLREAIESILEQTFSDFELIIINDGSTDSSKDIIRTYSDPRIICLENARNVGICVTLNRGLDIARGEFIARMDADDISKPDRLSVQVEYLKNNPQIGIVGSDIEVFGEGIDSFIFELQHNPDLCSAGLLFNPCFAHPSVMWRKEISDVHGLRYDNKYRGLEDGRLWWEFAKITKLNNISQPLLRYRKHQFQETKNMSPSKIFKSNEWRKLRFESFVGTVNSEIMEVANKYSFGRFDEFTLEDFRMFCKLMSKVVKCQKYPIITSKKATKETIGRAVIYTLRRSSKLSRNRIKLLFRAYSAGCLSLSLFTKYLILFTVK